MRTVPNSYILSFLVFLILWLVFGFFLGEYLVSDVNHTQLSVDDWKLYYYLGTLAAALATFSLVIIWFSDGSKDESLTNMKGMKVKYRNYFIFSLAIALGALLLMFFFFFGDDNQVEYYIIYSIVNVLLAPGGYWIATLYFSPENVKYIPFGAKKD